MPADPSHRIIAIGETMIMVTPTVPSPLESATDFRLDIGGAESNVATHLAALGHACSWVSRVGDDALGRRVERMVRERGVDTSLVEVRADAPTGVYFKDPGNGVLYYRRGSAASTMDAELVRRLPLKDTELVHLSGITTALSASCSELTDAVLDEVSTLATTVSFDINYRPALWSVETAAPRLRELAERSDLVFVGLDEAETLWGCRTAAEVRVILPSAHRLVVKDGAVGATEFSGGNQAFVPAGQVDVVEAVGAGDAFAAGYLAAYLSGGDAHARLAAGHQRAALVLRSTTDFVDDITTEDTRQKAAHDDLE